MAQDEQIPSEDNQARERTQEVDRGPRQFNSELAKAFEELAKGERTATALESRLDDIEGRIEQLLASVEEQALEQGDCGHQLDAKTTDTPASK